MINHAIAVELVAARHCPKCDSTNPCPGVMDCLGDDIRREIALAEDEDGYVTPCTLPVDNNGIKPDCDGQCDGREHCR